MEHKSSPVNSLLPSKQIHYTETSEKRPTNTIEGKNVSILSEMSRSSAQFSGDANSDISIETDILDIEELDSKPPKVKLEDLEYKVRYLQNENDALNEELLNERKRNVKLEKKLQFVKDNQEVFMRLKEAYINMKYNEAAGRKMIEIKERGMQTWGGTVCSSCIESEELRRQIEIMIGKYNDLFVVSPGEMERLMNTVKYLKDLIQRREETWSVNVEREHKFQCQVAVLEDENARLRNMIASKQKHEDIPKEFIEEVKLEQKMLEERRIEEMQKVIDGLTKDIEKLKKIIVKYEKKMREIRDTLPERNKTVLNDKETRVVQQIIAKFSSKIHNKIDDNIRSRSPSVGPERIPQNRRPSSPLRSSTSTNRKCSIRHPSSSPHRPISPRIAAKRGDSAILMMDYLFE